MIQNGKVRIEGTPGDIKSKFNESKRYVMKLKDAGNGVLAKIHNMAVVKMTTPVSNGPSGSVKIEMYMP